MDALAGYGSDSDNSDLVVHSPGDNSTNASNANGISSLLGHYAGDSSDDDDNNSGTTSIPTDKNGVKNECQSNANGEEAECVNVNEKVQAASIGQPTTKRRKRWDDPNEEDVLKDVLPTPPLLTDTIKQDPYQSLTLFHKDYTTSLRLKLSQQLQTQSQHYETNGEAKMVNQQLSIKLEHLYNRFQKNNPTAGCDICSATTTTPPPPSFAAHLKSKHEFGNPHLLKTIIDHFHIQPLQSHIENTFMGYEYMDRLISVEERAGVSAVNYDVSRGEDLGKMSGSGDENYHLN